MKINNPLFMDEDTTIGLGKLEYKKSKVFRTRISLFNLEKAFKAIKAINNRYVDIVVIKDKDNRDNKKKGEGDIVVLGKSNKDEISGIIIAGCFIEDDGDDLK